MVYLKTIIIDGWEKYSRDQRGCPLTTQLIDEASCDLDLRSPPSNHFEKLRGNLAGKHAIRVNKQWRLVFTWSGERGEARAVYLDNHDYR